MARLVKNIDTRTHGPLKAGHVLNGIMDETKIAELIASGHAEPTEDDGYIVLSEKVAENASGESESLFERAFQMGYAFAVNDAVDSGLISASEAGTVIFQVDFDDDELAADGDVLDKGTGAKPEVLPPAKNGTQKSKANKPKK